MQRVYINKRGIHSIEIEEPVIDIPLKPGEETTLDIEVINYETPLHIYLSSSGDIKDKVKFNRNNPYIDGEEILTLKISNPRNRNELHEGKITISTGYGSIEESFRLKIGKIDDEESPGIIEIDESLGRLNYSSRSGPSFKIRMPSTRMKMPSTRMKMPSVNLGMSVTQLKLDFERIRAMINLAMTNLPVVLIIGGVILTLIAFAAGKINYGAVILGLLIVIIIAYYTSKLID
ncbi:MAG TPA: hypothetical protein VEG44_02030 [Candidatus Acidoferrales bacterium]|nr:hypothetical protein [Candidatus Acidoferrales bacterium]